ncbi:MAG: lysylphosphatidylglycerol synthase transmembrane domain-containing protein [Proteobacteria bacterium]|nr:lysylphosphatidylglycerol synthase transmembrane domain-containing protein [Pseudomonadota bacterium]
MTRKHLFLALKILVSVGLIAFLVRSIDLGDAKARVMAADTRYFIAAVVMMLLQMGIAGARWWSVMRAIGRPLPWIEVTRLFYIGVFFSQALPSSVGGDPIRMYMAYRDGLPLSKAINGVMLERVVTILALVVMVAAVQPFFLPKLSADVRDLTILALAALAIGGIAGTGLLMVLDRLPARFSKYKIVRGLGHLAADTRALFLAPGHALHALAWGVLSQFNLAFCVFLLAQGLAVEVTLFDCAVLMPPVMLVTTLPISIAGWGVREGAMAWAFGLIGVAHDASVVLSLSIGVLGVVIAVPAGVLWLLSRRRGDTASVSEATEVIETEIEREGGVAPSPPAT